MVFLKSYEDPMKDLMYFAHANGFPSACYQKFFHYLNSYFEIAYIDILGHHPDFPVTDNWEYLVDELIASIEKNADRPVIGVGHSLGGILMFLAASKRPELFKTIVLLDAPVIGRLKSYTLRFLKRFNLMHKVTPSRNTHRRRTRWLSFNAAWEHFKKKSLFAKFDEDCLKAYIDHGMKRTETGLLLKFDRNIEHQIYQTFPHNLPSYRRHMQLPMGLLVGEDSDTVTRRDKRGMKRHLNVSIKEVKGGHLFPFEYPEAAAERLRELLSFLLPYSGES